MLNRNVFYFYFYLNLVCRCICDEIKTPTWNSYQQISNFGYREELFITEVVSDRNFGHGLNVTSWKTVSLSNISYSVGLMQTGVVLLTAQLNADKNDFVIQENIVRFEMNLTDCELFEHWNETELKFELILVIAFASDTIPDLVWFRIVDQSLSQFWTWHLHKNVSHLHYFKFDDKERLLLISSRDKSEVVSLDLYEFSLGRDNTNFWLSQAFSLTDAALATAVNVFGSNLYLSIPQESLGTVLVYKLVENLFEHFQNIESQNVTRVVSFRMGFKSFLAINGDAAGIYQFTKSGIVLGRMENLNLEDVNVWLPVQVKTYRDEVMLIVEHNLHHDTHSSHFLESVIYDFQEQMFLTHDEVGCSRSGEVHSGLSCMIDEEHEESGLSGASVLSLGKVLGVIVAHRNTSALFTLRTDLRKLKNPVEIQVEKIVETKSRLEEMMESLKSVIETLKDQVKNSSKLRGEDEEITTPSSNHDSASTPAFLEEEMDRPQVETENLRKEDETDLEELQKEADKIRQEIEEIKTKIINVPLLNKTEFHFDEVLVSNGEVEVHGESVFESVLIENLNDEPANDALNDIVRKSNLSDISGHKTFTDISIQNLTFKNINGARADDIIFDTNDSVIIKGNLIFDKPLKVNGDVTSKSGKINDRILLEKEIVGSNEKFEASLNLDHIQVEEETRAGHENGAPVETRFKVDIPNANSLNFANIELDSLKIPNNITVLNVNGENFDEFLRQLCFVNIETNFLGTITIDGDINSEMDVQIKKLNGLKFPGDYVLHNSQFSLVNATKTFEAPLTIGELFVAETINGIPPESLFCLRKNQTFEGTYTFRDLEATNIGGSYLENFLKNPILNETKHVKAKVVFKFLEVEGAVVVSNKYNDNNLEKLLNDVVYADEEFAVINSIKAFPEGFTVRGGLTVLSNAINENPLDLFITTYTEQTIDFPTLNGFVSFENLNLGGLYGGVDVTKLALESVKLTGEQITSSTLIFENDLEENFVDLSAENLVITKTLNNLTVSDYFFATGDSREINYHPLVFEDVETEKVFVEGEVSGILKGFSLEEFDARRLSLTRDQIITGSYSLEKIKAEKLNAELINGEPFEKLFDQEYYANKISEMLFGGQLAIKTLHVNGSLFAETVNDQDMSYLKNSLWTNKENNLNTATFKGDVVIKDLSLKNFNGIDFSLFTNNLIFKTETDLVLEDFKVFTNGFHVVRLINSERLNDVHVDDILTKIGHQEISGPLNIYGNVRVSFDTEIGQNFNEVSVKYLADIYQFTDDTITINEDVVFNRHQYIEKFIVNGEVNGRNLQQFISNVVYKSEDAKIEGLTVFENYVEIHNDLVVAETVNAVDLSEFVDEMVFLTKDDAISGVVIFTQPVYIEEELAIESSLETQYLMGINTSRWNNEAVFVNRGLIPGTLRFESVKLQGDVQLKYINEINLNNLVPLQTDQEISHTMSFNEIVPFQDVPVGNLVNGYKLPEEYQKSILTTPIHPQHIKSVMIFKGNVLTRDNLEIFGLVNEKDLGRVVTTDTDQNLTAPYHFNGKTILKSNLIVFGRVNDVDLQEWQARSVKTYTDYPQNVYDHWVVDGGITFMEEVVGDGLIGGLNMRELAYKYEEKRSRRFSTQNVLMENYVSACKSVNALLDKAETQVYFFKYFDHLQTLEFGQNIENVHYFEFQNQYYILVSETGSCMSFLFIWTEMIFEMIYQFETGSVVQMISVYDGNFLFFVTLGSENSLCSITGTNVWKFEPENILRVLYKLEDHQLLQDSMVPGTFYGLTLNNVVFEYKLATMIETNIKRYRKWILNAENLVFVPRGLGTSLALSNGYTLYRLIREDLETEEDYDYETESCIIGKVLEESNSILPGRDSENVHVLNVGPPHKKRSVAALAFREETGSSGKHDFVNVYEEILSGKLFTRLPVYKPTSLISLEFGSNGENLLLFLEDEKMLQVYEYKGIDGFKHRSSLKMHGSKLFSMNLPIAMKVNRISTVGVISNNKLSIIKAVMVGNQVDLENPTCEL